MKIIKPLFIPIFLLQLISVSGQSTLFKSIETETSDFPTICIEGPINYDPIFCFAPEETVTGKIKFLYQGQALPIIEFKRVTNIQTITIHFLLEEKLDKPDRIGNVYDEKIKDTIYHYFAEQFVPLVTNFYIFNEDSISEVQIDEAKKFKKITYDQVFSNSFLSDINKQESNLDLIFIIQKDFDNIKLSTDLLKYKRFADPNSKNVFLSTLFYKVKDKELEAIADVYKNNDKVWFIDDLDNLSRAIWMTIENQFTWYVHSDLKFCLEIPYDCEYKLKYDLTYQANDYNDKILTGEMQINAPQEIVEGKWLDCIREQVDDMVSANNYISALNMLAEARNTHDIQAFQMMSEDLIYEYGDYIYYNHRSPFRFFEYVKSKMGITAQNDDKYKALKTKILTDYYDQRKGIAPLDSLMYLNDALLELEPENQKYIIESHLLNARENRRLKDYYNTANEFLKIHQLSNSSDIIDSVSKYASMALKQFFDDKKYAKAYNTGDKYFDYIKQRFNNRYRFAFSAYNQKKYTDALNNYQWLLNNWVDAQSVAKWDEVHGMVVTLYALNNQYDNALDHFQRYYRKTGDSDYLTNYLAVLRAKFLFPVVSVSAVMQNMENLAGLESIPSVHLPDYVVGLYVFDAKQNQILARIEQQQLAEDLSFIANYSSFPLFIFEDNPYWMANKKGADYFLLHFSGKLSRVEENYLSEVQRKKSMVEPWQKLYEYEQNETLKYTSKLVAGLFQIEYNHYGEDVIDDFGNVLIDNSIIDYVVFHDDKGEIINNFGFNRTSYNFDDTGWTRSCVTLAYFKQNVEGPNGKVSDIAIPVLKEGIKQGVLRIGFLVD